MKGFILAQTHQPGRGCPSRQRPALLGSNLDQALLDRGIHPLLTPIGASDNLRKPAQLKKLADHAHTSGRTQGDAPVGGDDQPVQEHHSRRTGEKRRLGGGIRGRLALPPSQGRPWYPKGIRALTLRLSFLAQPRRLREHFRAIQPALPTRTWRRSGI
jgi:hypothetical protein